MATWHLTWATELREVIFSSEDSRRFALRALLRVAGERTVLFNIVDDHIHLVVKAESAEVGRLGAAVLFAMRPLSPVRIDPARVREVEGRAHLERLVHYVLDQSTHHGLDVHPALWSGSCFADLIGARVLPGFSNRLGSLLPRFRLRTAYSAVRLSRDQPLEPLTGAAVRSLGACRLRDAASAAVAAPGPLLGSEDHVLDARAAVVIIGLSEGFSTSELSFALGLPLRNVQRLAHRGVDERILRATRLRLALEEAIAKPPLMTGEPPPPEWGTEEPQAEET